ncbi:MAG: ABC transporter permease [Bacteroidota bacterium]
MLQHYLQLTLRLLWKNKFFSLVNIAGLALSMAAAFFIFRYVSNELSYDRFHQFADQLYRVNIQFEKEWGELSKSARVSPVVGTVLQDNFPAIEALTRLIILGPDGIVSFGENASAIRNILMADANFFQLFSFELTEGNPKTALSDPFKIMLAKSVADQFFKGESAVGKTIEINADNLDGSAEFVVSGVYKDFPENTHIKPGVLISYATLFEFVGHRFDESWDWNESFTYVKLNKSTDLENIENGLNQISEKANQSKWDENATKWQYELQNITDIHLQQGISHEIIPTVNEANIWFLGAMAVFILVIAYINYVNLSIVKSFRRLKEVGVRKVAGANRKQLFAQFLLEVCITNSIAFVLALLLFAITNGVLENYFEIKASEILLTDYRFPVFCLLFFIALLLSCGAYLGILISAFQPASIFKGKLIDGKGLSGGFKQGLMVLQFVVSILFLIATFLVYQQVQFMQKSDTGMDLEKIVVINSPKRNSYSFENNFEQFKNETSRLASVVNVAASGVVPGEEIYRYHDELLLDEQTSEGVFKMLFVSTDFFKQYDIELLAGKDFTTASTDWWIINESAMKILGFDTPEEAVGTKTNIGEIIGVVKDYHHESLKTVLKPTLFACRQWFNFYTVKLQGNQFNMALNQIESTYQRLFPGSPFTYFFADEFYNRQYQAEKQFTTLFAFFALLVSFISCLGFVALTGYEITQRTKEIGIRKTFGASKVEILLLLSKKFMRYIFIAIVIAIPLANYLLSEWLEDFAYHIEFNWLFFALPCIMVILVAFLAVSGQSIKAANVSPANSMREE